jgi:flagellar biosynthesis protein FlhB
MSDKTEEPTPARLRKAQREGDVALSAALASAVAFLVALTLAPAAVRATVVLVGARLQNAIRAPDAEGAVMGAFQDAVLLTAPLLGGVALAAAAAAFVQTGGAFAVQKLAPDGERLNPLAQLKSLVSGPRLFAIARALVAALVVGVLAYRSLRTHLPDLAALLDAPERTAQVAGVLVMDLGWSVALVSLALGGLDYLVTRRSWLSRLRMTKDEVKREHKDSEGDPELKAARHRAHQEALNGASLTAVRQATVLVVNPTHLATALRYRDDEDEAPRVLAQGQGELAQRMIAEARAHGIPVIRDVPVARALQELEVGDEIPEALYEAVAEILRDAWEQLADDQAAAPADGANSAPGAG